MQSRSRSSAYIGSYRGVESIDVGHTDVDRNSVNIKPLRVNLSVK